MSRSTKWEALVGRLFLPFAFLEHSTAVSCAIRPARSHNASIAFWGRRITRKVRLLSLSDTQLQAKGVSPPPSSTRRRVKDRGGPHYVPHRQVEEDSPRDDRRQAALSFRRAAHQGQGDNRTHSSYGCINKKNRTSGRRPPASQDELSQLKYKDRSRGSNSVAVLPKEALRNGSGRGKWRCA